MSKSDLRATEALLRKKEAKYLKRGGDVWGPIEDGIFHFLVGLNVWGIRTTASCEGHNDCIRLPYPSVEMKRNKSNLIRATRIVVEWNLVRGEHFDCCVDWTIHPKDFFRIQPVAGKFSLQQLQNEVLIFAGFLLELPPDYDWAF